MAEENAAEPSGEAKPAPKSPKGMVLIGALVGGLLLGAGAGLFALGPMLAKSSGYDATAPAADSTQGPDEEQRKEGAPSTVHLVENLILNPAGTGGSRFLMLQVAIDVRDATAIDELKARDAETRDVILRVMGKMTVDELADMGNRDRFREMLTDSLGALFKKKGVLRRVYFPQFVIQ